MRRLKQLRKEVIAEAKALREHTTDQEKLNLCDEKIDAFSPDTCIYGWLTGCCHSPRAGQLMKQCAKPFARAIGTTEDEIQVVLKSAAKWPVSLGKRDRCTLPSTEYFFSPIEAFLPIASEQEINLLRDFIAGDTDIIDL